MWDTEATPGVKRPGRRYCNVGVVVAVAALWKGAVPGVCAVEAKASPSMAGDVLCFKLANAAHIVAKESWGFSLVAKSPGNSVGINVGYCWAVRI